MRRSYHQTLVLALLLCPAISLAVVLQEMPDRPAPAAGEIAGHVAHIQTRALDRGEIPPLPQTRTHLHVDYNDPARSIAATHPLPKSSCDLTEFAVNSGAALVAAVRSAAVVQCLNGLYSITGQQAADTFNETKMVTIANAMHASALSYTGDNSDSVLQLVTFLRAGYYVQYGYPAEVGEYGPALSGAIRPALSAFFDSQHIGDVNDAHGEILSETVTLVDSAGANGNQLFNVLDVLGRYGASHHPYWHMLGATNNVFTVLFKGQWDPEYIDLMSTNAVQVGTVLVEFINDNKQTDVGSDREYMMQNAAGELGRLLMYGNKPDLRPLVKSILDQFTLGQPGAGIYVRLAGMATWYDSEYCAYYGLCNFEDDLEAAILPPENARQCSVTLRVRSQALTSAQLDDVCDRVSGQEAFFHTVSDTGGVPVADDYNEVLEMVVFHSSTDYETYSGIIFGNDTNNGGMYLEGNPADPNNQARFLAYEAEWLRPEFEVWNLHHEYVHYLDGRFNWYGGFASYPMQAPWSSIWAIEGLAEYIAWSYEGRVDSSAVQEAGTPDKFTFGQVLDTVYTTDYTRTYQWTHLATRFMFERQRDSVADMHAVARVGDFNPGYRNWVDDSRTVHNSEFRDWLICFHDGAGDTSNCGGASQPEDAIFADGFEGGPQAGECPVSEPYPVLDNGCMHSGQAAAGMHERIYMITPYLPQGLERISFTMSGGSGDADMYVREGVFPTDDEYDHAPRLPGNDEVVVIDNPPAGYIMLMLRPGDSLFSDVRVRTDWH